MTLLSIRTEEEQRRYTEAKQQAQLEVQQTTATIEEKNRQLIASQTILQENCKRMQSLLNEVNHPSLQAACQQLEAGAVNQTLMDSIRDVLQAEMTRVEKEYAEQEQRIRTLRAERDTSMKAKQALEVESELVKKTISLEINKMEMAIRELTQQIEVGFAILCNHRRESVIAHNVFQVVLNKLNKHFKITSKRSQRKKKSCRFCLQLQVLERMDCRKSSNRR